MPFDRPLVDALFDAPLGVTLLGWLEAQQRTDLYWEHGDMQPSPEAVDRAVGAVADMSFGALLDAAVYLSYVYVGPWISDAPDTVAFNYRHADLRRPIAEAVATRFGAELSASFEPNAQEWWFDTAAAPSWVERSAPLFRRYEDVYSSGQFTWAGLRSVTNPPDEVHQNLLGSWEFEIGPVARCTLPVRPGVRIAEIHRPEDWAQLVREHPRVGDPYPEWELPGINQQRRELTRLLSVPGQRGARVAMRHHLVPDWRSVADAYDGVHLSWAGFLTSEGCITDLPDGDVTMLRYWGSERTLWLSDVFGDPVLLSPPSAESVAPPSEELGRQASTTFEQLMGR
ncbi:MAG: hypothetical protein AAFY28_00345 [Actinomycetota bacterium]